ncbi:MAG: hypothetical protein ACRCY3_14970 [Sphingorhabdus sp.]
MRMALGHLVVMTLAVGTVEAQNTPSQSSLQLQPDIYSNEEAKRK